MTIVSSTNAVMPVRSADPTVVFVVKQAGYTLSSLAMVAATVILALNHFIQDGEIVTLLVTAVGSHVLASINGTATTTQTTDSANSVPGTVTTTSTPASSAAVVTPPATTAYYSQSNPGQ